FPNVLDSRKHNDAPRIVENHESRLPHTGPNTNAFVIVTAFIGKGAMIACPTMSATDTPTAHGPLASIAARRLSTFPAFGPTISSTDRTAMRMIAEVMLIHWLIDAS